MLQPGQTAPEFSLHDADMQPVELSAFRGKKLVVLYFYPRDGTPGCTLEATDFSDHDDQFGRCDCGAAVAVCQRDKVFFRHRDGGDNRGLIAEGHGRTVHQHRRKLSERPEFVTLMLGG